MRPLILTLEGFTGIRDGMKRDTVTIDLSSLPEGLIALTGPNGAGKTTIMDNLHPYRIMPSRASKLSVDAFSYWDHLSGTHAQKVFEWEHAGVRYRSSFAFRKPGKVGKAEYFLAALARDGHWQPVTLSDGTVSDGKGDSYDQCVEAICGSLESFFTSVFSAQNRRPLASFGASEIKALLAELLKIDHLREMSATAGEVVKVLGRRLDAVQQQIVAFASKRECAASMRHAIAADVAALSLARTERETVQSAATNLTQQRASLVAKQGENAGVETRLRELAVRREELETALRAIDAQASTDGQRIGQRRLALQRAIVGFEATLKERDAILGAAARRDEAQLRISDLEAKLAPLQAEITVLDEKRLRLTSVQSTLNGLEADGKTQATLLKTLQQQAAVVNDVPCAGMDIHSACPLLAQARDAGQQAKERVISLANLRERFKSGRAELGQLAPAVEALAAKQAQLQTLNAALTTARQALQRATDLAARKPLLDSAESGLKSSRTELATLQADETDALKRREAERERLNGQLRMVDDERARLASVDVTSAINDLDRQLTAGREQLTALDARIEALIRSQVTRESELVAMEQELSGADGTQSLADRISDEIAHWKIVAKSLGNEGVIALTIDDAGPALTKMVNDLLLACYGTRFTVEIQTQRTLANGEQREGFEILVHDAESENAKSVGVMSGGQKVWINECLTRGIALYIAGNARQPYQSLYSDESDGPLDPQRKVQFMRMKREVLRLGRYEREFFISQTPDLIAEADAVIDVAALAAV